MLLRHLYGREELYQLLFTYALVLILGDAGQVALGHAATIGVAAAEPGRRFEVFGAIVPHYNLFIIAARPGDRR